MDTAGIAAPYSDPIARIRAQDESAYINSAIRMTQDGDWLTPKVMGRLFLFKPPLLMWMTAAAVDVLGLSLIAVRLPSVILGAAGVTAMFLCGMRARSRGAGLLAAGLLLSSQPWRDLSTLCYTDVPGSAFVILALLAIVFDPLLARRRTPVAVGALGAAAVLTKSVAGLIPLAALGLYWMVLPRDRRPHFKTLLFSGLTAALVLAPWHLYQVIVHPKWFYADYVQFQLLGIGLKASQNGVFDRPALFYVERLIRLSPVLGLFTLVSVPGAFRAARSRQEPVVILLICWTAVTVLALIAFQAKNLPYLVFLLPPLCALSAVCAPRWIEARPMLAFAAVAAISAVIFVAAPVPAPPPVEGAAAMRSYYALNRDSELIACDPDDEFYGTVIPIPKIRYCFVDPGGAIGRVIPHYPMLGIVLTGDQFLKLPELMPGYRARLAEWGLDSTEPVGTAITLNTPADLARILRERPDLDAYIRDDWANVIEAPFHIVQRDSTNRVFLLSRIAQTRRVPPKALPSRW